MTLTICSRPLLFVHFCIVLQMSSIELHCLHKTMNTAVECSGASGTYFFRFALFSISDQFVWCAVCEVAFRRAQYLHCWHCMQAYVHFAAVSLLYWTLIYSENDLFLQQTKLFLFFFASLDSIIYSITRCNSSREAASAQAAIITTTTTSSTLQVNAPLNGMLSDCYTCELPFLWLLHIF